jgi:far upstream element-binding protein
MPGYGLPQPTNTGSLDLSSIKPVNSGSVSLNDALAKARSFAAEKGISYDSNRGGMLKNFTH